MDSTISIRTSCKEDQHYWDAYVATHSGGNVYLASGWGRAIQQVYGHPLYNLIAIDQNDVIVGLLPLVHIKHFLFGNSLFSAPFADLGGILADTDEIAATLLNHAFNIATEQGIPTLELRQAYPLAASDMLANNQFHRQSAETNKVRMLLELPGTSEELMAGFKAKLRSQIRRPLKDGLCAVSGGVELLDDFYRVFAENMRDLGSPVHAQHFIKAVIGEFSKQARVFIVYKENAPLACSPVLGCGQTLYNPWASSLRRYSALSPNMLLYWAMLEYACDHGFKVFDFGRSTPEEGTYKFKKQWGAVEHPLNWQIFSSRKGTAAATVPNRSKFDLAMQLWQKLPVSLSRMIGPPLRKHIGL